MKTIINNDLSTLTTIDKNIFSKLDDKIIWCISNCIEECIKNNEDTAEIEFGIGTLKINFLGSEIKYRFIPSETLNEVVSNTIINERNDLVVNIEKSLVNKLTDVYKSFF